MYEALVLFVKVIDTTMQMNWNRYRKTASHVVTYGSVISDTIGFRERVRSMQEIE